MVNPVSNPASNPYGPAIAVGTLLAKRYRVLQVLGQGGFGRTYRAADTHRFDEICVLKEFAPQVSRPESLQLAEDLFKREAAVLHRLNHSQIPRFRELRPIDHGGFAYWFLIQDFIEGSTYRTLQHRAPQNQPGQTGFSLDAVVFLLKQLLPVLDYIHQNGVIHRDISPDNLIQRQSDGLPVLIDFGAVKQIVATVLSELQRQSSSPGSAIYPAPGTCIGKQGFAPPEQFQSGQVFPHSDLYALGATALTLLTGQEPSQLIHPQTLEWILPPVLLQSPPLAAVVRRMVALRPSDRYPSAALALKALNAAINTVPNHAQSLNSPPLPTTHPPATRLPLAAAHNPGWNPPIAPLSPEGLSSPAGLGGTHHTPPHVSADPPKKRLAIAPLLGSMLLALALIGGGSFWGRVLWSQNAVSPAGESNMGLGSTANEPTPEASPAAPPVPELPPAEQARKRRLLETLQQLGIPEPYLNQLVNDQFYGERPELDGRSLSRESADQDLRDQWDDLALGWLETLEALPLAQRRQLGGYGDEVRDRWIAQINQKHLSTRALDDLVGVRLRSIFPDLEITSATPGPKAQIWRAIAAETVPSLLDGTDLTVLKLQETGVSQTGQVQTGQVQTGNVLARQGVAHILELKQGQSIRLTLDSTAPLQMAFYPPYSTQPALLPLSDDSSEGNVWEGSVEHDGFYEIVLVAAEDEAVDYTLTLVANPPEPDNAVAPDDAAVPEQTGAEPLAPDPIPLEQTPPAQTAPVQTLPEIAPDNAIESPL